MTAKEYFIHAVTDEIPRFERVLKSIPATHRDYRPDPKAKTAMEIAASIVGESSTFVDYLTKGVFDWALLKKPTEKEPSELANLFAEHMNTAKDIAAKMTDAEWEEEAKMLMNGKEVGWKSPRGLLVLSLLLDLIHHRGQLSTYLRPMGGKVPSIYGPSADSAE